MYPPASRPENNLGMVIKQRQRNHVLVRVSKIYFEWNQCKFLFEAVVNRHRNGHNICEMASLTVLRERSLDMHSNQLTRLVKRSWCTRYSSTCNTKNNHKKRLLKFVCGCYTTQVSRAGRLTTYRKTTLIHYNVLTGKRGKVLVVVHEIPRWGRGNARGSAHAVLSSCRRARGLADDLDGLEGRHGGRF